MSRIRPDKKITRLEPTFADVLVCKNAKERPMLEIFTQEPENISQQNLGKIIGILEIDDQSEDSSYIVNYLISVVKKEYFSRSKRGPIESFEAALHKANLALSKLAEHGNINWIGKINAAIAIIEKNNLHISCAGSAKVLLLRLKTITDVSEKSEPETSEPNPIKTFEEVLSGRLENEDKLILATESIFNIFSLEEIKKSALKFSDSEFIRFLKTALVNELEKAAVIVVDAKEKQEEREIEKVPRKSQPINAFSQSAFSKNRPQPKKVSAEPEKNSRITQCPLEKEDIIREIKEEAEKTGGDFVDKKTGHIYIKENSYLKTEDSPWEKRLEEIKTSGPDYFFEFFSFLKKSFHEVHEAISKGLSSGISRVSSFKNKTENNTSLENGNESHASYPFKIEKLRNFTISAISKAKIFLSGTSFKKRFKPGFGSAENIPGERFIENPRASLAFTSIAKNVVLNIFASVKNILKKVFRDIPNFLPRMSRLKSIFSALTFRQKVYSTLVVSAIIIIPYFIAKSGEEETSEVPAAAPEVMGAVFSLENDRNVLKVDNLEETYAGNEPVKILNVGGNILAVSEKEVADIGNGKKYTLPENFKAAEIVCAMDDLELAFLMDSAGKIISFSPLSGKFQENSLALPVGADIVSAGTYLTYIYILDAKNSQIYRYPRAEGGFGEKSDWLKDKLDLSAAKDMAISDTVYVSNGGRIIKLFQGKNQDFRIENTATPVSADSVYTKEESQNIYILDKANSRVIKLNLNGNIIQQYYNSEIKNAIGLAVDEENNKVYFSTESSVKSFEMKQ
ncbi:MAG: hypothetical protein A2288_00385 [Candidatus Moranbacteria bacterium RIFOXYA12_FULL_44_15]|nr:MAG: hypothetical protein A2288_00385 [Candidatus Moranbacteria bacterium RIFOXYA12_FULL_44_15]OGI35250.1 MAG: hypothetical protein A2259_03020 [Candidatus Moranbacteria bacterium RIFOXYA2_FULL_43_15]